jgi:hypothetical protein
MRSLLRQGSGKLRYFVRRPGVRALRDRALADAARTEHGGGLGLRAVNPPKVLLRLEGFATPRVKGAIEIEIPPARR